LRFLDRLFAIAARFAARFRAASLLTNTAVIAAPEVPLVFKFLEHALWWASWNLCFNSSRFLKCISGSRSIGRHDENA
jgi:hypothetical protein